MIKKLKSRLFSTGTALVTIAVSASLQAHPGHGAREQFHQHYSAEGIIMLVGVVGIGIGFYCLSKAKMTNQQTETTKD
ncbi:MAG: hypothetical protein KUG78_01640 [Kangiellaceae bacterium]|nr:hypothetical protein [Kangiellaceae bacterium]